MKSRWKKIPAYIQVTRGQTQKDVNKTILEELINIIDTDSKLQLLDLPCGNQEFLKYIKALYKDSELYGADIKTPANSTGIRFKEMDLSKEFSLDEFKMFDVITSISGVMMFGNTQNFIENCSNRIKAGGIFVITNDNSATIKDRISYLLLGRFRIFDQLFEDHETLTQLVIIQDLTRLMRLNNIRIEKIIYTSFYLKDLLILPLALLVYPLQSLYLLTRKTSLSRKIAFAKYSFKQLLFRHYVIIGRKGEDNIPTERRQQEYAHEKSQTV